MQPRTILPAYPRKCTRARIRVHAYTHTSIHQCTHTHTSTCLHIHARQRANTPMHTRVHYVHKSHNSYAYVHVDTTSHTSHAQTSASYCKTHVYIHYMNIAHAHTFRPFNSPSIHPCIEPSIRLLIQAFERYGRCSYEEPAWRWIWLGQYLYVQGVRSPKENKGSSPMKSFPQDLTVSCQNLIIYLRKGLIIRMDSNDTTNNDNP